MSHLYRAHEVIIRVSDEGDLDAAVYVEGLLRTTDRSSNLLASVTNLRILAPLSKRTRLKYRCLHHDADDETLDIALYRDDNGGSRPSLQVLGILHIMQKLQDGKLRTFRYVMACVRDPRDLTAMAAGTWARAFLGSFWDQAAICKPIKVVSSISTS